MHEKQLLRYREGKIKYSTMKKYEKWADKRIIHGIK
jgi:hypothetical protein